MGESFNKPSFGRLCLQESIRSYITGLLKRKLFDKSAGWEKGYYVSIEFVYGDV